MWTMQESKGAGRQGVSGQMRLALGPVQGEGGGQQQRAQTQEGRWLPAQGRKACSYDSATRQRRLGLKSVF